MRVADLKSLKEAYGDKVLVRKLVDLLGKKDSSGRPVLRAEDVSIRGLWEALVGPVEETLPGARQRGNAIRYVYQEEVTSTAFPKAVGALLAQKVIAGYDYRQEDMIGDRLVEVMPSRRPLETVVGFTATDEPLEVDEGKEYEGSSIEEKYVTTTARKRGRKIEITEETILFDQTSTVLRRALNLGRKARLERERRIIRAVVDADAKAYKPSGAAQALYSAGNKNLKTSNALVDWTDVEAAWLTFSDMTDEKGSEIVIMPKWILVPHALWMTLLRILSATATRDRTNPSAGTRDFETVAPNPLAAMSFTPLTSLLMDKISTTNWFLGNFVDQFCYHEIYPLQTLAARQGHEDEFDRDVVFKYKVREFGDCHAIDHRHVVKNQA